MILNVLSVCVTVLVLSLHLVDSSADDKASSYALHENSHEQNAVNSDTAGKWRRVANTVNRVCFIIFLLTFIAVIVVCGYLWSV